MISILLRLLYRRPLVVAEPIKTVQLPLSINVPTSWRWKRWRKDGR